METITDIAKILSPVLLLTLAWSIFRYFIERKHKRQDTRNLETKEVLSEVLSKVTAIKTLLSEFLFLYMKDIKASTKITANYEKENPLIQFAFRENLAVLNAGQIEKKVNSKLDEFEKEELIDFLKNSIDFFKDQSQQKRDFAGTVEQIDESLEQHAKDLEKISLSPYKISPALKEEKDQLIHLIRDGILDDEVNGKWGYFTDYKYKILQLTYSLESLISEDMKKL